MPESQVGMTRATKIAICFKKKKASSGCSKDMGY
jgi:hypothetical protein